MHLDKNYVKKLGIIISTKSKGQFVVFHTQIDYTTIEENALAVEDLLVSIEEMGYSWVILSKDNEASLNVGKITVETSIPFKLVDGKLFIP